MNQYGIFTVIVIIALLVACWICEHYFGLSNDIVGVVDLLEIAMGVEFSPLSQAFIKRKGSLWGQQ